MNPLISDAIDFGTANNNYEAIDIPSESTLDFELTAQKNGDTWDLTGATVNLILIRPTGSFVISPALMIDGPAGKAVVSVSVTEITKVGGLGIFEDWYRYWLVQFPSGIRIASPPFKHRVY